MSTLPVEMPESERRELAKWIGDGMTSLLDADARLSVNVDPLPRDQVADTRRCLDAAIERYESLMQLVQPGVHVFRSALTGQTDENGNASIRVRLDSGAAP